MWRHRIQPCVAVLLWGVILVFLRSPLGPIPMRSESLAAEGVKKAPESSVSQTPANVEGAAATASGKATAPVALPQPLIIEQILLKDARIHVVLKNTGDGALAADAYTTARLTIAIHGGETTKEWTLLQVDPTRRLGQTNGRIDFDTEIGMEKKGPVSVMLARGSWMTRRLAVVSPGIAAKHISPSTSATTPKKVPQALIGKGRPIRTADEDRAGAAVATPGQARKSAAIAGSSPAEPVPMLNDAGGIRISTPAAPQIFAPGDRMYVVFYMQRHLDEGDVVFHLYRSGTGDHALSTKRVPYRPIEGEWSGTFHWALPVHGLPPGSDYYIHAVQTSSGAWGTSDTFDIQPEGDGLIEITRPGADEVAYFGRELEIQYRFAQRVGEGLIFFDLFAVSLSDGHQRGPLLTKTFPYRPPAAGAPEPAHTLPWRLPEDLPRGDRYFILASHPEASGHSKQFSIDPPLVLKRQGEQALEAEHVLSGTAIEVMRPAAGSHFRLDEELFFTWRMPDEESAYDCGDRVRVDLVRQSDGSATTIRGFTPSDGTDSDRWLIRKEHTVPGMYHLKVVCDKGCVGRSASFRIDGCDYGIESVQLAGGRNLEDGVDASGPQTWISGNFKIRIEWNGELPPVAISGDRFHEVTVIATRTGASIRSPGSKLDPFNYTQADASSLISVTLPFLIPKDDIHRMLVGQSIPLEFQIAAEGPGEDTDDGNNRFSGELRIRNYLENDLEMSVDIGDLTVRRTPRIGPRDEYYLGQTFRVRNLSRNNVGGPPDPVSIRIGWSIHYNDPGHADWAVFPDAEGEFTWDNVGADWSEGHLGHSFESAMPDGRRWRIVLVADPHNRLIDPNRINNKDTVTFSLAE